METLLYYGTHEQDISNTDEEPVNYHKGTTMIYKQVTSSSFHDAFRNVYENNFSYEGREILFEYLNELGQDIELDVVDIACTYAEQTYEEILAEHYAGDIDENDEDDEDDEREARARHVLEHELGYTIIGETTGGFVHSVY